MQPPRIKTDWKDYTFTQYPELPYAHIVNTKKITHSNAYKEVIAENIISQKQQWQLRFSLADKALFDAVNELLPDTAQNPFFTFYPDASVPAESYTAHFSKDPVINRISGNELYSITLYIEEVKA